MPAPKKKKPFQDYYLMFDLPPTASQSEIKTAYRELALKVHPDKNPSPKAHEQFLLLNEAYHILNNKEERAKYDIRYKSYYNPHKKSAGLNERIELTRAKRASRYGRTMYSQRMRYRSSSPGSNNSRERKRSYTPPPRNSNYDWDVKEPTEEEMMYRKYASIVQFICFLIFLLAAYNLADYFFQNLTEKLGIVEVTTTEAGDTKVIAQKYYNQSYIFYVPEKSKDLFQPKREVQLERSYFEGRLYKIRIHKGEDIFLINPIRPFYDLRSYFLITL
ncbi:MAG: DnaJ domain-containing protein [Bacteroidota bacterium]